MVLGCLKAGDEPAETHSALFTSNKEVLAVSQGFDRCGDGPLGQVVGMCNGMESR